MLFLQKKIFEKITEIAHKNNIKYIVYGSNIDNLDDYRPGMPALKELNINSPLQYFELTKKEIKILSKGLGLSIWNKQSFSCLAQDLYTEKKLQKKKFI